MLFVLAILNFTKNTVIALDDVSVSEVFCHCAQIPLIDVYIGTKILLQVQFWWPDRKFCWSLLNNDWYQCFIFVNILK